MSNGHCDCTQEIRLDDDLSPEEAQAARRRDAASADVRRHVLREAGRAWDQTFTTLRATSPPAGPDDIEMIAPVPGGEAYPVSRSVAAWTRAYPRP
jgi:hypothetical protein